jgi:hypothetical protein
MACFGRPGIGKDRESYGAVPTDASEGFRRHCPLSKTQRTCRVATRRRQDSRVTSKHGENESFVRVTAYPTGLEPKTVLRGSRIRQVEQPRAKSPVIQHLRRISHSKPRP